MDQRESNLDEMRGKSHEKGWIYYGINIWRENGKKRTGARPEKWQDLESSTYNNQTNISILTGNKSKIIVVDLDRKDEAYTAKKWFEENIGPLNEEETLITETGSKGHHIYYKYDERVKNNQIKNQSGSGSRKLKKGETKKNCFSHGSVQMRQEDTSQLMGVLQVTLRKEEDDIYNSLVGNIQECAKKEKYRKMEGTGAVYKRKRAFAYELFIEKPEKFLNTILRGNPMWLSNAYNIQKLSLYMTKYDDHNFPYLETDEAWYGFKNGIYNIETCEFVEIPEGCDDVEEEYICEEKLGEKVVRKYFDINFRKTLNTEHFDKVLKYQFNDEVVEFIYAMIGRMFGIRDKWDVMLYLLGESGCGKSVVLDVVRSFFDKVGNINETFEDKFGLGYIKDKDIIWGKLADV
ncbi:hypothetical protein DFJ73DRAFT_761571 [Zopfochytrium polystomum]|nr:hypothetical protein DFJ73DRAFT_761571 [Zopfochytrium polystomum]